MKMKRLKQLIRAAIRKVRPQRARAVPLMVPHGGGDASSDFESAFEMLQGDERARELWHGKRTRIPFARAS
jgi:hypothetical protein